MSDDQAHLVEVQRFRQWWIVLVVLLAALPSWLAWTQLVTGAGTGDTPAWLVWLLWLLVGVGAPALALLLRLETRVEPGRISVRFPPFRPRVVATDEIVEAHARQIRPIAEWGGYGYRRNLRGGTAFIVHGPLAVELVLPADERLVIGTQEPVKLATAIAEARRLGTGGR